MTAFVTNFIGKDWQHIGDPLEVGINGCLILDGKPVKPDRFAQRIAASVAEDTLAEFLASLNGFYVWIVQCGDVLWAGVDQVRSRPLFYGQANGRLYLSDQAEWVRQQVGDTAMDPLAREEFRLAGYVTGRDTLYPNVKQLQAGEYFKAESSCSALRVAPQRYFRFWHTEPERNDPEALSSELSRVTLAAMQRLIAYAGGRQLVLPLSGGYDSRLIATLIRELRYPNVLCFSYGMRGNQESEYSRGVATALGFDWEFVGYSAVAWKEAGNSGLETYRLTAANHTSLPHVQDWLAIRQLVLRGSIAPDAVVVPGHTGDFISGGHIPSFVFTKRHLKESDLLQAIIDQHLSNCPPDGRMFARPRALEDRIRDRLATTFEEGAVQWANLYESWDWQERQAKFIVNSVRVYEYFGLDWWLPLWDMEFVRFWEQVPLALRRERRWFKRWIVSRYDEQVEGGSEGAAFAKWQKENTIKKTVHSLAARLPRPIVGFMKSLQLRVAWRKADALSARWEGDGFDLASMFSQGYKRNGIYAEQYLAMHSAYFDNETVKR